MEKPAERSSGGACDHGGVDPDIDGIRADRGTSGGVRTVWLGISNLTVCAVFHFTAVYLRGGCGSGGTGGIGTGKSGDRGRIAGSACGGSGADLFCGSLAAGLLSVPGRKTGELYLGSGDGRIYQWYLYHDHSDAGAEIIWRQSRRRRTSGTAGTYLGEPDGLSSTIAASGRRCTGDPSGIQKDHSQISDGSASDGTGSNWHGGISAGRSGDSDTRGSETGTSGMGYSGFWIGSVKRSCDGQPFGGSCHHGRNITRGEQLCTEKPLPDQ